MYLLYKNIHPNQSVKENLLTVSLNIYHRKNVHGTERLGLSPHQRELTDMVSFRSRLSHLVATEQVQLTREHLLGVAEASDVEASLPSLSLTSSYSNFSVLGSVSDFS